MQKNIKLLALIVSVLMLSACSNGVNGGSEKIAVVKWDKAVAAHPEHARLLQGEKVLKTLVLRRDAQAALGKSQMSSVEYLRGLKQLSEQSYYNAELQTELMTREQMYNDKINEQIKSLELEAEQYVAPHRKAIEDEYRLRIFNLRLEKDRARANMRPMDAKSVKVSIDAIEAQITALTAERETKLLYVEEEKQAYIGEKIAPQVATYQEKLRNFAEAKRREQQQLMASSEGKYDKLMADAPEALGKALAVMDKEIDKQQDKNKALQKKINADIESVAVKLAKERGYTIVFNTFKANVSADDITDKVIAEIKKK